MPDVYLGGGPAPNPTGLAPVEVNGCFNPDYIPEDDAKQCPAVAAVRSGMAAYWKGCADLSQRRTVPDEMMTQAANAVEVARLAEMFERNGPEALARARSQLNEGIAATQYEIDREANLKADEYAAEIRKAFKGMKPNERIDALVKAVDQCDRSTLAAILDAPELVTGVPADLRADLKQRYFRKVAPGAMMKLDKHLNADARLKACEETAMRQAYRFYEGTAKYAEKKRIMDAINASFVTAD